ncbi:MAG: hypothetical protein GY804_03870 [Alphaproteobacteria bacterium]|nr:hypothetical protein [Alphaproteobacteria bacterium]
MSIKMSGCPTAIFTKYVENGDDITILVNGKSTLDIEGFRFTQKMKLELAEKFGFDRIAIVQHWYRSDMYSSFASGCKIKYYVLCKGKFGLTHSTTMTNR